MKLVVLRGGRTDDQPSDRGRCYEQHSLAYLDERMQDFISRQDTMFVTSGVAEGRPEPGVAAGPPGFVRVLDEKRLAWPAAGGFRGTRDVELLFVDLFPDAVRLAVTGTARVGADGRVVVDVGEAAMESAKPMPRLLRRVRGGAA
jgi:predicted pyridoxine 5'-phosphate oxidase superfamily flavin-nucleotide-binding protein